MQMSDHQIWQLGPFQLLKITSLLFIVHHSQTSFLKLFKLVQITSSTKVPH